ncbi:DUF4493 domain-containing protein [uncultured Acetobacteroides sp.]|uniref:DUF4493 domain-containing protein n=1 Tax=uncultured Acetobacteroides sp. TaxID=1760811 RepID=UPI0029F4A57B|nr:DUF4493 domain-containing protein [uncultured Acetobacteroides sp.]
MKLKLLSGIGLIVFLGCSKEDVKVAQQKGFVKISAQVDARVRLKAALAVDNYDVSITSKADAKFSYGKKVSAIGANPVELEVGEYTIKVNSPSVALPGFSVPLYGASQDFAITAGTTKNLSLVCKQTNAGIKVGYSDAFKKYCTDKSLSYSTSIEQAGSSLTYATSETRVGYFNSGTVNVTVNVGDKSSSSALTLAAQDLVNLSIDMTSEDPSKVVLTITGVDDVNTRDEKITISLKPNASTETLKLSEDFASITTGDNISSSGSAAVWAGDDIFISATKAYKAGGAIKLGIDGTEGSIVSKTLDLSANSGNVTVKVKVKGWEKVESSLLIMVDKIEKEVPYNAIMSGEFEEVTASFPKAGTSSSKITIKSSKKRLFIDDVKVYN